MREGDALSLFVPEKRKMEKLTRNMRASLESLAVCGMIQDRVSVVDVSGRLLEESQKDRRRSTSLSAKRRDEDRSWEEERLTY
jgi:hypothetical protein